MSETYSAFDEARENSQKWFEEWKNSIDHEEYQAIIKEHCRTGFDAEDRPSNRTSKADRSRPRTQRERRGRTPGRRRQGRGRELKRKAEANEPPDPRPTHKITAQTKADVSRAWSIPIIQVGRLRTTPSAICTTMNLLSRRRGEIAPTTGTEHVNHPSTRRFF